MLMVISLDKLTNPYLKLKPLKPNFNPPSNQTLLILTHRIHPNPHFILFYLITHLSLSTHVIKNA